ncbi:hypothetical protein EVAR_62621_1 [Eumeta japonica]|uniref:Uncharacterized protein n=1 Tax=Eumeta variegata TaxID=151549 RepID=A0A4C1ZEW5_EUMVA|nr:hypothetical protein EVAR_62621_1 [Eumeta japonica]
MISPRAPIVRRPGVHCNCGFFVIQNEVLALLLNDEYPLRRRRTARESAVRYEIGRYYSPVRPRMAEGSLRISAKASPRTSHSSSEKKKNAVFGDRSSLKFYEEYNFSEVFIITNRTSKNAVRELSNINNARSSNGEINEESLDDNKIIAEEGTHINKEQNNVIDDKYRSYYDDVDDEIKGNVWSDVDDDLYIAKVLELRTSESDGGVREKRDTSVYLNDKESDKVVNSVKDREMWELEPAELSECECLGPPPEFLLPPPPRPPFLHVEYNCGDGGPIPDLETCDTEPVSGLLDHTTLF